MPREIPRLLQIWHSVLQHRFPRPYLLLRIVSFYAILSFLALPIVQSDRKRFVPCDHDYLNGKVRKFSKSLGAARTNPCAATFDLNALQRLIREGKSTV